MSRTLHRGEVLHLTDDPRRAGGDAIAHFADGALLVEDGLVIDAGDWADIFIQAPDALVYEHAGLILPGFIDAHVHYPQAEIIGAHGTQLLDWLDRHAFPAELKFADKAYAQEAAAFFLDELLRHGTTTALVFATVHDVSVEALFEEALKRNMRILSGKVLMDSHAPEGLIEPAQQAMEASQRLINHWRGRGRLGYAVTPRFAPCCTEGSLDAAGRLLDRNADVWLHTHLSENAAEEARVAEYFPDASDYLDVYARAGLVTERSVFAHGVHLSADAWRRVAEAKSAIAFCPTSNTFLGSGLFDLAQAEMKGAHVALGTDVGGGTSFSMLATMAEAYKVTQLRGRSLDPFVALYLATLGSARALGLHHRVGSFAPGCEADFTVIDWNATPLLARRMASTPALKDRLFALMMLGDDRAIAETWVMGKRAHVR